MIAGQRGSYLESQEAGQLHLGIVPIGMTGGSAKRVWKELNDSFGDYRLGGKSVNRRDFDLLMASDHHAVALATIRLVKQALYMD
jgi:hypothetical protein